MTPNESTLEEACLDWFRDLGYAVAHGPDLAPGEALCVGWGANESKMPTGEFPA